ncbi:MAG: hypothetical protein IT376_13165 [Polyangiaceae bacterium]|nr:hypothetical protein [Polyangiaceae bacterium]
MRGWFVGVCVLATAAWAPLACTSSEEEEPTPWASGGRAGSGGTGGARDPSGCLQVECKPPPCCGDTCASSGDCCAGTVCSLNGRCIPSSCSACGDVGCVVDFSSCTSECATPDCCLTACTADTDCCAGTRCRQSTAGEWKCYPDSCDACGGMQPLCSTNPTTCATTCEAPDACGDLCESNADCDAFTECNEFASGTKKCVPLRFDDECSLCGSSCSFFGGTCEVECGSSGSGGTSGTGGTGGVGGATTGGTGGAATDAGTSAGGAPSCAACCAPCASDSDCCAGSVCYTGDGNPRCVPRSCDGCDWGCTYYCPS